jgi:hypothetical protein
MNMLAPTFRLCDREAASPSTCTTLLKLGSGRKPFTGEFRLRPRSRLDPRRYV